MSAAAHKKPIKRIDWSYVDQFIFINLDKRRDRRRLIEAELKEIGVPQEKLQRFAAIELSPGYLGCSKSHLEILRMAKRAGWKNYCVIEDDIQFNKTPLDYVKMNAFLRYLRENDWDVGLVSFNAFEVAPVPGYASIMKALRGFTTGCYMVNSRYYDTLLANFEEGVDLLEKTNSKNEYTIDTYWQRLMPVGKWYWNYPNFGFQREDFSDIEGRHVNYKHLFYKKMG